MLNRRYFLDDEDGEYDDERGDFLDFKALILTWRSDKVTTICIALLPHMITNQNHLSITLVERILPNFGRHSWDGDEEEIHQTHVSQEGRNCFLAPVRAGGGGSAPSLVCPTKTRA